jgi:hypothetical protein
MKSKHGLWPITAKVIIALGFFAAGAVFYLGCGEDPLPPPNPPQIGTITVSGGAV